MLLNFARAAIVDDAAVIAALAAGRLRAYVCDFPNNAPQGPPQGRDAAAPRCLAPGRRRRTAPSWPPTQLREFLENGNVRNSVNFPEAVLPRLPSTTRLAIANRNVPNMVGQISTCLAMPRINIADLLNKSRGEYAYTLIDADGALGQEVARQSSRAIEGVLAARIL